MSSRSRSPEDYQSRSRGRSQDSRPRSKTGSLSPRRSPSRDSRSPAPRRNGRYRDSRSRSLTRSRSRSRDDRVRSPSRGRSRSRSESPLRSTKIVVERLTKNVTEEHLREIFGAYGTIHDMDVPLSRQFGTNRGAAYILYANESDAESAIAHMHEAQLDGATISVSIVLQRRKLSPPPPTANRGANFDPRLPPPGRGPRGPSGGGMGGPRGRGGRGGGRFGRGGPPPPSDTYRPRSISRSRSRSPAASARAGRYRTRSPSPSHSRSGTTPPSRVRRGRGGRYNDDFDRRRSPSRDSPESYGGHRGARSHSRDRRSYR